MAHDEQLNFVARLRERFPAHFTDARVVEFGSLDINGSVRQFFERCNYTGIDLGPGNGVDWIGRAHAYPAEPGSIDTLICCEMLEHDCCWQETIASAELLLRVGGLLVLTCATGTRPEHGTLANDRQASPYTPTYYRNLEIADLRPLLGAFVPLSLQSNGVDLQCWGIKR